MAGRSTTIITYEPHRAASPAEDPGVLARLQEKVRALERQNAALRQTGQPEGATNGGARGSPGPEEGDMVASLIEVEDLDGTEGDWLCGEPGVVGPGDEVDWLRRDLDAGRGPLTDSRKKSLVNRLDDLARRGSPAPYTRLSTVAASSPLHSYLGTPGRQTSTPLSGARGPHDSRTFSRGSPGPRALALPEDTPPRKTSYHRLTFGARAGGRAEEGNGQEIGLDQLELSDVGPELKTANSAYNGKNSDLNLTYNNCDDESNLLNCTFDKVSTPVNSTFNRGGALNSTFSKPGLNTTFEKVPTAGEHRKMSEDRLSSGSSSSARLSRESSQDLLVEDLDRLSTTSAMSESSASHRLNDVQDVQDLARLQEENLKHSPGPKHQRADTISPLSEPSLSSPLQEDGTGYQSEESCGSEGPRGPRRGEVQYQGSYQYSSQDSLPDSPYSSQSLDSHAGQGPDTRRSMPNLNKKAAPRPGAPPAPGPQYGLSQRYGGGSDSRLLPPGPPLPSGGHRGQGARGGPRPAGAVSGLVRPIYSSGLRPPSARGAPQQRKPSGIGRAQAIPRPGGSRLQAPGSYARRAPQGRGAPQGGGGWMEDCY